MYKIKGIAIFLNRKFFFYSTKKIEFLQRDFFKTIISSLGFEKKIITIKFWFTDMDIRIMNLYSLEITKWLNNLLFLKVYSQTWAWALTLNQLTKR